MRLIIARHGETQNNFKGIVQGQGIDTELSTRGIEQSEKLALRLKDEKIIAAYSSDLGRAVTTAGIVLKPHSKVKLIQTPILRSLNCGVYEGGPMQKLLDDRMSSDIFYKFCPTNGESLSDLKDRVEEFLSGLYEKYKDKTILVVTHRPVMVVLNLVLLHKDFESYQEVNYTKNTSVTITNFSGSHDWKVECLNDDTHLQN